MVGLYLHIPFCKARCGYCDFATNVNQDHQIPRYLTALTKEALLHPSYKIDTLFLGGGTPTVLSPAEIESLFSPLKSHFDFSNLTEATVEANPESATEDVLSSYKKSGINRISFGLQSTQNKALEKMDRLHTYQDFERVYQTARNMGFSNISVDLIFGLPGQTMADWSKTLDRVLRLKPQHVSLYALKIEEGTRFEKDGMKVDPDSQADMYLAASKVLKEGGYDHYEISNFALPGFASKHNLKYWRNEETLGLGLSSASYINGKRHTNPRGLTQYLEQMEDSGKPSSVISDLSDEQQKKEDLFLRLRLKDGVPWTEMETLNIPAVNQFLNQDLATHQNGTFRLTPKGWLLSNQLFQYLV